MLIGRFIGTLIAAFAAATFRSDLILNEIFLLLILSMLGLIIGMVISASLGINTKTDRPIEQDSLKYWVDKYGEDLGTSAYKLWLEELDTTNEDI